MSKLQNLWERILGTHKSHEVVHEMKNEFTREMLHLQGEAKKITKDTAQINLRLESTARKIYRSTGRI